MTPLPPTTTATAPNSPTTTPAPVTTPTGVATQGNPGSASLAKLGIDLTNLYQAYLDSPTTTSTLPSRFPTLQISGTKVLISVQTKADINTFASELTNLGMSITAKSATYGTVTGSFPINELSALANLPDTLSGQPSYKPTTTGLFH